MLKGFKMPKVNWRVYALLLATLLLFAAVLVPSRVHFSRDVLMLFGVIVVLALWPSLKSGKIPYIMEIKKKNK